MSDHRAQRTKDDVGLNEERRTRYDALSTHG
jgi:hypothetical protein